MYGAIGGGVAAVAAIAIGVFIFKRSGNGVELGEKELETFKNDIPDDTTVNYENPLYNDVENLDDPFDDDFN